MLELYLTSNLSGIVVSIQTYVAFFSTDILHYECNFCSLLDNSPLKPLITYLFLLIII